MVGTLNTDKQAQVNWTELCWSNYVVRGQETTVYLRGVT